MREVLAGLLALLGFVLTVGSVLLLFSLRSADLAQAGMGAILVVLIVPVLSLVGFLGGHGLFLIATFLGRSRFLRGLSVLMALVDVLAGVALVYIAIQALLEGNAGLAVFTLVIFVIFGAMAFWFVRKALRG